MGDLSPDARAQRRSERVREFERVALSALPALQLADGVFCEEMGADGRPHGHSLRATAVVLIGVLRAEEHGIEQPFHAGALRSKLLSGLGSAELGAGEFGLLLWAESRADGGAAEELVGRLGKALQRRGGTRALGGAELGWMVLGTVEAAARGSTAAGERILAQGRAELLERQAGSGLLNGGARGPRRRFPTFTAEIFGLLALTQLARLREDRQALDAAVGLAERLLELQMPDGGWPCILDARRGTVVDAYEIYAEHQDALAPLALGGLSEACEDGRYLAAALRGFDWIWTGNELGAQMLDAERGLIYRSVRRRQGLDRAHLYARAAAAYVRAPRLREKQARLEIDRSQSPEHLGWILEAWAGREERAEGAD